MGLDGSLAHLYSTGFACFQGYDYGLFLLLVLFLALVLVGAGIHDELSVHTCSTSSPMRLTVLQIRTFKRFSLNDSCAEIPRQKM
eukprot:6468785-Amphidinium_carterae.1